MVIQHHLDLVKVRFVDEGHWSKLKMTGGYFWLTESDGSRLLIMFADCSTYLW